MARFPFLAPQLLPPSSDCWWSTGLRKPMGCQRKRQAQEWAWGFSPTHQTHARWVVGLSSTEKPSLGRAPSSPQHCGGKHQPSSVSQHMLSHLVLWFSHHRRRRAHQVNSSMSTQCLLHLLAPRIQKPSSGTSVLPGKHWE